MSLQALIQAWCQTHPVKLCILFGSQATGKTHPKSDVDLAIWASQPQLPLTKLIWLGELEEMLGKSVSLVLVSPDTNPVLGMEIVRDGKLVFEQEAGLWIKYRQQLWHNYNDSFLFRWALRNYLDRYVQEIENGS